MDTFIYMIRPTRIGMLTKGATPAEEQAVDWHYERFKQGVEEGFVRLAWRTTRADENAFGIVIFDSVYMDAALVYARSDPAVAAGVMSIERYPFKVALP